MVRTTSPKNQEQRDFRENNLFFKIAFCNIQHLFLLPSVIFKVFQGLFYS